MRIDNKLDALQKVTRGDRFTFQAERILNNQYVKIQNWESICTAVRVLREIDWLPDDQQSRLLDDYLENRGDLAAIEVPAGEFQALEQALSRYNPGLPVVINTLQAHARSTSPETIWVEIRSASNPTELAEITKEIERALNIAGQVDTSFRFVGVAQGSDWLGFLPGSELAGAALNYCISLAASLTSELMKVTGPTLNAFAKVSLRGDNRAEEPTQDEIDERIKEITETVMEDIINEGIEQFIKRLDSLQYPPETQNQARAAMRASTNAIRGLGEDNRAVFEVSESGKDIIIEVNGDNNNITVQNFPEIPANREALPPADSDQ